MTYVGHAYETTSDAPPYRPVFVATASIPGQPGTEIRRVSHLSVQLAWRYLSAAVGGDLVQGNEWSWSGS